MSGDRKVWHVFAGPSGERVGIVVAVDEASASSKGWRLVASKRLEVSKLRVIESKRCTASVAVRSPAGTTYTRCTTCGEVHR